jgi:hypothetical protein
MAVDKERGDFNAFGGSNFTIFVGGHAYILSAKESRIQNSVVFI